MKENQLIIIIKDGYGFNFHGFVYLYIVIILQK